MIVAPVQFNKIVPQTVIMQHGLGYDVNCTKMKRQKGFPQNFQVLET